MFLSQMSLVASILSIVSKLVILLREGGHNAVKHCGSTETKADHVKVLIAILQHPPCVDHDATDSGCNGSVNTPCVYRQNDFHVKIQGQCEGITQRIADQIVDVPMPSASPSILKALAEFQHAGDLHGIRLDTLACGPRLKTNSRI